MPFTLAHPSRAEPIVFETREQVAEFARAEMNFWSGLGISGIRTPEQYARSAQTDFERLTRAASSGELTDNALETRLGEVAGKYFGSDGPQGKLLESLRSLGYDARTLTVALAVLLRKDDEIRNLISHGHWSYECIAGVAHVAAFESGGDPQRLVTFLSTIAGYQKTWQEDLERAIAQTKDNQKAHEEALEKAKNDLSVLEAKAAHFLKTYEDNLTEIRKKFEEQFALRTPIIYWSGKAERHRASAKRYVMWFIGLLIGGIGILASVAYIALFPFMKMHPGEYWALILFSVAIAVLAWPLRITSKQYLVHQQLFEDASERAVIAQTFLALGDQVSLTDADRQLLLGALLRPASVSLVADDSGLNVTDILLAKSLTKS